VIILGCVTIVILLNAALLSLVPGRLDFVILVAAALVGVYLLFIPARRLYKSRERVHATALFNKASYYPLALLILVIIRFGL
jgi:heme O synthase-like polyprenyltransferase